MADMLVKLYNIPNSYEIEKKLSEEGIKIKKALAPDRSRIIDFSRACAKEDYSNEVTAAFSNNLLYSNKGEENNRLCVL